MAACCLLTVAADGSRIYLLTEAKKLRTPLRAVVKRANTSAMPERLLKYGFAKQADSLRSDEDTFVWTP
jgi:hypothetical protein